MLLNEDVIKTASVGNKKGYFATFFIPPAEEDECVFQDIVKTEKSWRPDSSLSHHTSSSRRSSRKTPSRGKSGRGKDAAKEFHFDLEGNPERDRASTARSSKALSVFSDFTESAPPPPPSRSAPRNSPSPRVRFRGRGQPITYAFDEGKKAFATPKNRTKMTCDTIKDAKRVSGADSKERTCRTYSSYTVYQKRETIAISPYGEPNLKGAAGRYREQYKSMTNSISSPVDNIKESKDYVFNKFLENLTLRSTLSCRSPIGVLKRPPAKPFHKPSKSLDSRTTQLHKQAQSRMTTVQKDINSDREPVIEGWNKGVEYDIAMEMSQNLEKHRRKRSYSSPSMPMPTVAVAATTTTRLDAPRLRTQSVKKLTAGEASIRGGVESNLFEEERANRGPIKIIERKRRVRSPPLSKLSRDRFLPEAIRRRELEHQHSLAGLRIAGANTPVTDWKTESSRRPKSTMTATTKMQLESVISKSERRDLCDFDDEEIDNIDNDDEDDNFSTQNDCEVEDIFENDDLLETPEFDQEESGDAVEKTDDNGDENVSERSNVEEDVLEPEPTDDLDTVAVEPEGSESTTAVESDKPPSEPGTSDIAQESNPVDLEQTEVDEELPHTDENSSNGV